MSKRPISECLSEQNFFSGLSPGLITFLAGCATERQIESGQVLFSLGERADRFYLILSGSLRVEIAAIMGPALKVQTLGPGQIVGWSWLIPPHKWSFQGRAEARSNLLEFDGQKVLARCEEDPKVGYELLKRFASLMSERLAAPRRIMTSAGDGSGVA